MKLTKALEDKKLDLRLRDRLLAEKKLSKKELDKHIKSLEDSQGDFTESKVELKDSFKDL